MKKLIVGSVATLAVLGAAGASVAGTTGHRSAQEGGSLPATAAKTADVKRCDSGPAERIYNRIVNQPSLSFEGADNAVPGANLVVRGKGTLNVTFSAEDQLRGSTEGEKFDWAELEVWVDGSRLQPFGGPGDPMALTGSPTYAMNAAQFCGKVDRGRHHIQVVTRLTDNGNDDNLSLWIDDYTLHVEKS
jgi:hypothetical protein